MPKKLFILILLLSGCATAPKEELSDRTLAQGELPEDLKDQFAVKETSVTDGATPVGETKKTKKQKTTFKYPNRRPIKDAIGMGEVMTYDLTYFGVTAGVVDLKVLPFKEVNGRKVYHLQAVAQSSAIFSKFYKVNDTVESFMDYEGLFSHSFHVLIDESKQTRDSLELNDSEKGETYYWNRWNHYKKGKIEEKKREKIPPFPQDSMSSLYFIRNQALPDNKVISIPVVSEGKTWEAVVKVIRREVIDSPMGKVRTVVLNVDTKYQGILKKMGDNFIWLTDDDRRMLVRLEAKVKIGKIVAVLKDVKLGTLIE